MKVCEKVQRKGTTSYNEVADELVAEFSTADTHISPNESVNINFLNALEEGINLFQQYFLGIRVLVHSLPHKKPLSIGNIHMQMKVFIA